MADLSSPPDALVEAVARAMVVEAQEYRYTWAMDGWAYDYVRIAADRFARAALRASASWLEKEEGSGG